VIGRTEIFLQKVTKGWRVVRDHGSGRFPSSSIVALGGVQRNSVGPTGAEVIGRTETFLQKGTKATKGWRVVTDHGRSRFRSSFIVALGGVQRNSVSRNRSDRKDGNLFTEGNEGNEGLEGS
jgi:hypothetical protein